MWVPAEVPKRGGRRVRRLLARRVRDEPEIGEPVTKWFESDSLPGSEETPALGSPSPEAAVRTDTEVGGATQPPPSGRHRSRGRPRRAPRKVSPRREAQRRQRREARRKAARQAIPVTAGLLAVAAAIVWQLSTHSDPVASNASGTRLAAAQPTSTLFVGSATERDPAAWLALVSFDPAEQKGSVVYIPAHTAVEVPGRGLQPIGQSLASGGMQLLMVSTESLLGLDIDHYQHVTSAGMTSFSEQIGPLMVDVPHEVRLSAGADNARLLFTEGPQQLAPAQLVGLLFTRGLEGDDVELGARHLAFWDSLLDEFRSTPSVLGASVVAIGEALGPSDARPSDNADLLESLAGLGGEDLTLTILPVRQVSVGGSELYEADLDEVARFIDETLTSVEGGAPQVEVQVLNGNGSPGVGQDVAEALVGNGFRIALSGNARDFRHQRTEVITYDASEEGIAAAERARDLLGVGKVLVSAQEQGIVSVDLTIVVGKDFLRIR
jgi:hypothetical protein